MKWLDDEIETLVSVQSLRFFLIKAGSVAFCVGLTKDSGYHDALEAFISVESVEEPVDDLPLLIVFDDPRLIHDCAGLSSQMLTDAQERSKLSNNQMLFNWDPQRRLVRYFNAQSRKGLFVAEELAALPSWEWFSPLKEFVHIWALEKGAWLAHAATVGNSSGSGLLLVGPGGSGKSTTCAQMIQSCYKTCGDDYVLLSYEANGVFAHAIYRTFKLMPRFNLQEGMAGVKTSGQADVLETGKSVYFLKNAEFDSVIPKMFITEIIGLRLVEGFGNSIQFKALGYTHFAMSSHGQIPVWLDKSLAVSRAIFERLPCQLIEVKRDREGLEAVSAYIQESLA
ncbi:MAG: hypothetical protein FGM17_09155 [Polynucleobacter sp.]|nr:hypothetical protein [Polynucleobacter sp.]